MEGHGPASGNWIYNAGTNATGSVIFNAANPAPADDTFKIMVYSNVKEEVMFELQPGADYTQPVSVGGLLRVNDTTADIVLNGNAAANYSRTAFTLTADSSQLQQQ